MEEQKKTVDDTLGGFNYMDQPNTESQVVDNTANDDELSDEEVQALEDASKGDDVKDGKSNVIADDEPEDEPEGKKADKKEEVVEDEPEDDPETVDDVVDDEPDDNALSAFASHMSDKGLLVVNEDQVIETEEDLEKAQAQTIQDGIDKYKSSIGEEGTEFLNFVENGGKPEDFHKVYYANYSFEEFSIDEESNQKFVIRESLRNEGYNEEEIDDEIELYEDGNKLEARAKTHLNKLKKTEKAQKAQLLEAQEQYAQDYQKKVKASWDGLKKGLYDPEEHGGFKFTKKMKDDLWAYMHDADPKTGKTQYQKDEAESESARYIYAYLMKNNWDVKSLERQVKNKVVGGLNKKLGSYSASGKKTKSAKNNIQKDTLANPFKDFGKSL